MAVKYEPQTKKARVLFEIRRALILLFLLWALLMPVFYAGGIEFCAPFSALFRFPLFVYLAHRPAALIASVAVCAGAALALVLVSTYRRCRAVAPWLCLILALGVDIWGQILCYQAFFSPDKDLMSYKSYLYFSNAAPMDGSMYLISLFADLALFVLCALILVRRPQKGPIPDRTEPDADTITTDVWNEIFSDKDAPDRSDGSKS